MPSNDPFAYTPPTVNRCSPSAENSIVTGSPTDRPFDVAALSLISTVPGVVSDDRSPETISSVTTWPNVAGSTAVTNVVPVPIFTCPWRIADTAPIAGSAARSTASCGLNGEKFGVSR